MHVGQVTGMHAGHQEVGSCSVRGEIFENVQIRMPTLALNSRNINKNLKLGHKLPRQICLPKQFIKII